MCYGAPDEKELAEFRFNQCNCDKDEVESFENHSGEETEVTL